MGAGNEYEVGSTTLRASAILTTDYVATDALETLGAAAIGFFLDITKGSLTSIEVAFQASPDNSSWFDVPHTTDAATSTLTPPAAYQVSATSTYVLRIPTHARYMRAKVKGTGTVTSSAVSVVAQRLFA